MQKLSFLLAGLVLLSVPLARAGNPGPVPAKAAATQTRAGWFKRNFSVRSEVKYSAEEIKRLAGEGKLSEAASLAQATKNFVEPQGWREKRTINSALKNALKTSIKQARTRSRAGDALGTKDALSSFATLREAGVVSGLWRRWRTSAAENKAFSNTLRAAWKAGKGGDPNFILAVENLELAISQRGAQNGRVLYGLRGLLDQSLAFSKRAFKSGDERAQKAGEQAWGIGMWAVDNANSQLNLRGARRAEKLAKVVYGRKAHEQAAQIMLAARELRNAVGDKSTPSALEQALGPRIEEFRRMQAEQATQAQRAAKEASE